MQGSGLSHGVRICCKDWSDMLLRDHLLWPQPGVLNQACPFRCFGKDQACFVSHALRQIKAQQVKQVHDYGTLGVVRHCDIAHQG